MFQNAAMNLGDLRKWWCKRLTPVLITGCMVAAIFPARHYLLTGGMSAALGAAPAASQPSEEEVQGVEIRVFDNDSLADYRVNGRQFTPPELDSMWAPQYTVSVSSEDFFSCIQVLFDSLIYTERWDTLSQPRFWRQIMTLDKGTCLVSRARTREVIDTLAIWEWEAMGEAGKARYRDSLSQALGFHDHIYVTAGKNHYYQFDRVLPTIGKALQVFQAEGVDPWYAQAILLIESPGALHRSPVGAYGSFQLMEEVALEQGLVVNDSIDEREDFAKAAGAAARHIEQRCVRPIRNYLRRYDLAFRETDVWFRLLVLHAYHAGPGNVSAVLEKIQPQRGGIDLMQKVWTTEAGGFKNASQNYSQLALASMLQVDYLMGSLPDTICREAPIAYAQAKQAPTADSVAVAAP